MVVGAKVCELTEDLLWFVCGLYVGILTSSLSHYQRTFPINYSNHPVLLTKWGFYHGIVV